MRIILILYLFFSCNNEKIQKPFIKTKDNFLEKSALRHRNLHKKEDDYIYNYIKKNDLNYQISNYGFWYKINENGNKKVLKGDIVDVYYMVKNLKNDTIYIKNQKIIIDESDIIKGLNESLKMLGKNESGSFIIPSYIAYGLLGDKNKIKSEIPLIYEITILDIKNR